jgi:murein DD-endopeptidase MepM/ murein hydrolase activator NlpD
MVGGLALLVAAAGAATAGQAINTSDDTAPAAQRAQGTYVASLSSASQAGQDVARVSRSADRQRTVTVAPDNGLVTAAEQLAAERSDKLRDAADEAELYAEELTSDEWVAPTSGFTFSTAFGVPGPYWASGYHTGVDLSAPYGQPVVAPANGVVSSAGWDGAYGNQVRLQLENGDEIWLNHMSAIDVTAGQSLVKGQQVGRVGATGNVSSPTAYHIHLEYRLAADLGTGVDPVPYFAEHGVSL